MQGNRPGERQHALGGRSLVQAPIQIRQRTTLADRKRRIACIAGGETVSARQRHDLAVVGFVRNSNAKPAQPRHEGVGVAPVDAPPALRAQPQIAQLVPEHPRNLRRLLAQPIQRKFGQPRLFVR